MRFRTEVGENQPLREKFERKLDFVMLGSRKFASDEVKGELLYSIFFYIDNRMGVLV